ncbi:hypothetical protein PUATCC27989T_00522 [Phytobacter ursingii]|nr:hypothetical protein PUATCC27989T_00522 [Phytobacter ursingii]
MNRQIVWPGAIPLETDLLNTNKYTMIALAKMASAIMGTSTYVNGLACTPTSPASMTINIAPGEIYSLQNIDGTAYSSLAADTTHSILKQGYVLDTQSFTLTAPTTSGFSVNYLVQATYSDTDGGSTVLPYYNASNPSTAWSGPNNSGTAQYTVRQGICTVSLKAGVAATTGTQTTPAVDAGYIGLYVITVAYGASTVTAGNISTYANAPFLPSAGLIDGIQRNTLKYGVDSGIANAYVVNINPGILSLSNGTEISFLATNANTTSSTLNVCGTGAYPVLSKYGSTLIAGEIAAGGIVKVVWSATASSWFIVESTKAIQTGPTATAGTSTTQLATTAFVGNAITAATGRLLNVQLFTTAGAFTYTPTAGMKTCIVEVLGAGGGSGGCPATSASQIAAAAGGASGSWARVLFTAAQVGSSQAVTVGAAGTAGTTSGSGGVGGNSAFGSLIVCPGGTATLVGVAISTSTASVISGANPGGVPTIISGTVLESMNGMAGGNAYLSFSNVLSGIGGSSPRGNGGNGISGVTASGYGSGGSGNGNTVSLSAKTGQAGTGGYVAIWEYA